MTLGDLKQQDRLHACKDTVNELETRVRNIRRAILTVLDEDEDMALMYLSKLRENPFITDMQQYETEHEEVELLLEANLQDVSGMATRLELLISLIDNTEDFVQIKLDTARNKLLFIGTVIAMINCCLAGGSLVAGIFGMNLENGWDNEDYEKEPSSHQAFLTVVFSIFGFATTIGIFTFLYFVKEGVLLG